MNENKLEHSAAENAQETQQGKSVAKSTATMSICTLISRITGFVRTWAMAYAFGNTVLAAGYALANNLPNMIYELVAGGILSTAFLPIYLQQRNVRGRKEGALYANNLLSVAVLVLGIIAVLASIFAPQVMVTQSLFSKASDATVEQAVFFFRFFAFQIVFYGMSAVFSGLLNAEREYFWPAISSVFMNIISIITFFGYPLISANTSWGNTWIAIGVTLSIAIMAFIQVPKLIKTGFKIRPYINFKGEGLRDTVKLALPAIICTCINLIALSFMNSCALVVADNGPSSIQYAWMWYQFPYGVLCVALSTAMFTEMSECTSRGDVQGYKKNVLSGLRSTFMLIIPMAALVFVCASNLIGLYSAGKFTDDQIAPIALLLRGWAFVMPFYAAYMFLYRAYSSMKDLKTVTIVNFFLTIIQVTLYMALLGVFNKEFSLGLVGIAMADFVFYGLAFSTLLIIMVKRIGSIGFKTLLWPIVKVVIASVIGAAVCAAVSGICASIAGTSGGVLFNFIALVVSGLIGLVIIFVLCKLFKVSEITAFLNAILRKIKH